MSNEKIIALGFRVCLASSVLLGAAACSSGPTPTSGSSSTPSTYSGLDTFRGVFFGDGPLTGALADVVVAKTQEAPMTREQTALRLEQAVTRMKAEGWSQSLVDQAQAALDAYRAGGDLPKTSSGQAAFAEELVIARIQQNEPAFFDRFGVEMQSGDHLRVEGAMTDAAARIKTALGAIGEAQGGYQIAQKCSAIVVEWFSVVMVTLLWINDAASDTTRLGHAETIDRLTRTLAQ